MFNDGVIKTDLVKIAHLLKHLPGRIIMGQFERFFHGGSLWGGHIKVIYLFWQLFKCVFYSSQGSVL